MSTSAHKGLCFTCRTGSDLTGMKYEMNIHMNHPSSIYLSAQARGGVYPGHIYKYFCNWLQQMAFFHSSGLIKRTTDWLTDLKTNPTFPRNSHTKNHKHTFLARSHTHSHTHASPCELSYRGASHGMGYNRSVDGLCDNTTKTGHCVQKEFSQNNVEGLSFSAEHEQYRCKSTFIRKIKIHHNISAYLCT